MGASENRVKSQKMAADLLKRGYWHGRRATSGLSNIPDATREIGSAAYRRLMEKQRRGNR